MYLGRLSPNNTHKKREEINMKFGVREITDVVFRAKSDQVIGTQKFEQGEPVAYFDSAKTSTLESGSTTVYAQGGRGNPRLLAWEGDKTVTFTFEDALLSPIGFSILSGANLIENVRTGFHETVRTEATNVRPAGGSGEPVPGISLGRLLQTGSQVLTPADENLMSDGAFAYPMARITVLELEEGEVVNRIKVNQDGQATSEGLGIEVVSEKAEGENFVTTTFNIVDTEGADLLSLGKTYLVDFYVLKPGSEMKVSASQFAGYYYIEADTLFRRASDGKDVPAQFTIPKGKVQTNFNFTMASSGDPSSFTFTVDAFPDYTIFDRSCKQLFTLTIGEEATEGDVC